MCSINKISNAEQVYSICFELCRTKQKSLLQKLNKLLINLPADILQPLHEVILLPLRQILVKTKPDREEVVTTAECLQFVFQNTHSVSWEAKADILKHLLINVTDMKTSQIAVKDDEEIVDSVFTTLICLLNSCQDFWKSFYSCTQLPILGHLVSLCLSVLNTSTCKPNKHKAIDLIMALSVPSYYKQLDLNENSDFSVAVGNCMACFMPGVTSTVAKIIHTNLGRKLRCSCLNLVAVLLTTTLGNEEMKMAAQANSKTKPLDVDQRILSLLKTRDQTWIDSMLENLNLALAKILLVKDADNEAARLCMLGVCRTLLFKCSLSLKPLYGTIMNPVLKLLNDSSDKLSKSSTMLLEDLVASFNNSSSKAEFMDGVKNNLFTLCTELPHKMRKYSENEKVSALTLLQGYLTVLKDNLSCLLNSSVHLDCLIDSILLCYDQDTLELCMFPEVALRKISSTEFTSPMSRLELLASVNNFQHSSTVTVLVRICRLLGKHGDIELLVGILSEAYSIESKRLATVAMIKEILLGTPVDNQAIESVVDELLDLYTEEYSFNTTNPAQTVDVDLCVPETSNYSITFPLQAKSHPKRIKPLASSSMMMCLQLESFAVFSMLLETKFCSRLVKVLYPLLEKVSHTTDKVAECAVLSLAVISRSCGYASTADLIKFNADYLASTLSLHLQHLTLFPRCPDVLQAILKYDDKNLFPLIRDTIQEILSKFDSSNTDLNTLQSFVSLFVCVLMSIQKWFDRTHTPDPPVKSVKDDTEDILEFLREHRTKKLETEENQSQPEEETNADPEEVQDTEEETDPSLEKPPEDVTVVLEILRRCRNLTAHKSRMVRIMVLVAVADGIVALSGQDTWLLPMVHQLWPSIVSRFEDQEMQVVQKAFEVICVISSTCGDFIRKRLGKEILPKLMSFLKQQQSNNRKLTNYSHSSVAFTHTALYKLQLNVLQNLGPLLVHSSLGGMDITTICASCYGFLSITQPPKLQESAVILFRNLITVNGDAVWLFLSDIFSVKQVYDPPDSKFKFQKITVSGTPDNEFAKNIGVLLPDCTYLDWFVK
uniref:TELO2-interacting protein 1 homolog n=1 Tax=Ciona intestinalis TaxID=7719 RepID=UPI000180CD5B|nr:TELO2-interacting protein 1 homolog [Ciona intestinalis]|eukprot:XP_002130662.1 TELO2-interacting protein 1 homolog [Ciona intestinalis]